MLYRDFITGIFDLYGNRHGSGNDDGRVVGLAGAHGPRGRQRSKPDLYYEVCYGSLVSKPAEECEKPCEFLGIPYDEAMLHFHEGREQPKHGRSAKSAWLRVAPGLRDWRSEMSAEELERFEAAAGDLLDELGYPRGAPHPTPEACRAAGLVRASFAQELLARGDRPPGSWKR